MLHVGAAGMEKEEEEVKKKKTTAYMKGKCLETGPYSFLPTLPKYLFPFIVKHTETASVV
jgi:hypothetical protein